ncbi:MAG: hypothetical protein Q6J74_05565, partial [Gloeomargarita sp. DG02_1_bins_92]
MSLEFDRLEAANMAVDHTIPIVRLPELVAARGAQANPRLTVQNDTVKLDHTMIPEQAGTAIVSGKIDVASGNTTGGQVAILGQQIALLKGEIDASGGTAGGQVWVGGNYLGRGPLPNAQYTFVSRDSLIKADALQAGNGGEVIIWSDQTTRFGGNISAKGGVNGGNGGFVEVSGKENLDFTGQVDTSAPQGKQGTLLLDPNNIVIVSGIGGNDAQLADGKILFGDSPGATFTIGTGVLATQLALNDVVLEASNDIVFTTSFFASGSGTVLSAEANNNISVNGFLFLSGIELEFAAGGRITTGSIFASKGIRMDAEGTIRTGDLFTSGGNVGIGSGLRTASVSNPNVPSDIGLNNLGVNLSRAGFRTPGGGDVSIGNVTTQGGDIGIATVKGKVETGHLDSSNFGDAGNIGVGASRDVVIRSARAESAVGQAGSVVLGSLENVRVTGTGASGFSISTRGGGRNGGIGIVHSGFNPFSIGNSTVNGTAGAITTGLFTLSPSRQFSFLQLINPSYFSSGDLDDLIAGSIAIVPLFSLFGDFNSALFGTEFKSLPREWELSEDDVSLDTSDFTRLAIAEALGAGDFAAILALDDLFSNEFSKFLGVNPVNDLNSVEAIGNMLSRLQQETGKKPAIIYLMVDERQLSIAAVTPG